MLLAVDIGNTNLVFALMVKCGVRAEWRVATRTDWKGADYAAWLAPHLARAGVESGALEAMMIGSVVPALDAAMLEVAHTLRIPAYIAGQPPHIWGIELDVEEPASVGADRVLNALAAHALYAGEKIVIDFGTATTFDYVSSSGAYKGGLILPGLNLSLEALAIKAAKLPHVAVALPPHTSVIGRTTQEQMQGGIYWGYVALVEGLVARMKAEVAAPTTVLATGGLAGLIAQNAQVFDAVLPHLTLQGLARFYAQLRTS